MRKPVRGEEASEILSRLQAYRREGQRLDGPHAHPFPARMPAVLAEFLIEQLTDPGDTVLDPMVGSKRLRGDFKLATVEPVSHPVPTQRIWVVASFKELEDVMTALIQRRKAP